MGVSILASVTESKKSGDRVTFWDLNEKKVFSFLDGAHKGKQISHIKFIHNEPVIITSSNEDNSIKMWLFEKGLSVPRLLK